MVAKWQNLFRMRASLMTLLNKPFFRFAISGGIAAATNVLSRMALSQITQYSVAIVIAYLIGMTTAYLLMRVFVFERSGRSAKTEYIRFGLVNVVALIQVWMVSVFLARFLFPMASFSFHAETVAHVIGVLSPIATSYFLHKYFTFAGERET